ncbi:hypothetical protein D9758_006354 [Tetrapyrgos nigripes]|uniref:Uncharacterized protein n=1 Tax=Tetrapyrgos nigripes TaxID=182062 RepID=A0A8H5D8G6_9AGAR|nr:hypothetical protein D9758_006354 [Tetrapyrgos nigripes]
MRFILFLSVLCLSAATNVSGKIRVRLPREDVSNKHPTSHSSTAFTRNIDFSSSHPALSNPASRKRDLPPPVLGESGPAAAFAASAPTSSAPVRRDAAPTDADNSTDTSSNDSSSPLDLLFSGSDADSQPAAIPAVAPAKRDNASVDILHVETPASPSSGPVPDGVTRRQLDGVQSSDPDQAASVTLLWGRQFRNADYSTNKASDSSINDQQDSPKSTESTTKPSSSNESSQAQMVKREANLYPEQPGRRLPRAAVKRRFKTMQTAPVQPGRYEDHQTRRMIRVRTIVA